MSSDLIRWGGPAAVLGGALGIAVAPVITSAYSRAEEGAGQAPPWEPILGDLLSLLFTFGSPATVYATYGKLYFLVFVGFLLGLAALGARQRVGPLGRWGLRLSLAGVALNLLGNVADYWLPDVAGIGLWGFVLGTLLGLLVLVAGSAMLGVALLKTRSAPRLPAWLLILAVPGTGLLNFLGFSNLPSGPVLWFCFAWLLLGFFLWSSKDEPARHPAPAN